MWHSLQHFLHLLLVLSPHRGVVPCRTVSSYVSCCVPCSCRPVACRIVLYVALVLYAIAWWCVMLCHVMLCYVMLCCFVLCCAVLFCFIFLCVLFMCCVVSCRICIVLVCIGLDVVHFSYAVLFFVFSFLWPRISFCFVLMMNRKQKGMHQFDLTPEQKRRIRVDTTETCKHVGALKKNIHSLWETASLVGPVCCPSA